MSITLTEPSKELVSRLLLNEFDKVDLSMDYIYNKSEQLLSTAKEFGLTEVVEEMEQAIELENI